MRRVPGLLLSFTLALAWPGQGQLAPPGTGGIAALANALRAIGANKRVLMVGAHPDDEDTALLVYLARRLGVQAAYLSLNRGEGGQNLVGSELGPELGVLRTAELLAARQIDGARQYFTRAFDFGFSKTVDETFRFWPRDSVLHDVLDVMRRFRPQVVVSVFSGTPRDGHGHHQAAGILTYQAFEILKDSSWGPVKLYRSARFDSVATLILPGGELDPITGRSYNQLALASRGRHRSQGMGQLERPGPAPIRLALWDEKGQVPDSAVFAGVDTLLPGRATYAALIDSARAALGPWHPGAIVPLLVRAHTALGTATDLVTTEQRGILDQAIASAAGIAVDGVSDDWIVVGGARLQVEATVWNTGSDTASLDDVHLSVPTGWTVEALDPPTGTLSPGALVTRRFVVTVAADAPRSRPYFLARPMHGSLYDWSGGPPEVRGLPFAPPPLELDARLGVRGASVLVSREVSYRVRDEVMGEVRKPIVVDCPFDVAVPAPVIVWPLAGPASGPRHLAISLTSRARGPARVRLVWAVPAGWPALPSDTVAFGHEGETSVVDVPLALPPLVAPGTYTLTAAARGAGPVARECDDGGGLAVIDYPHIRPEPVVRSSTIELQVADIGLPRLTAVGYVRGAADQVPEALAGVGVPIEILGADSLAKGALARYDAIVIGSRAYETDPAVVANNDRLLAYARGGGLLIVQYQQYPFVLGGFAPYRLSLARPHDRVTDETAPVTLLDSVAPLFRVPNQIGAADWKGWVQERGLYFAHDWDSTYRAMLEMHDPGDPPLSGGLLVAPVGRGTYVYTGLAFFRQLPAGVPGAYRLFANLLALKAPNVF
ncbi:MAG TPA: PIG-L family deacetylase [Gemmatimonadales bacterium]|nr:PIG-L family deacetylase [Gemmatimonadales bacterium]